MAITVKKPDLETSIAKAADALHELRHVLHLQAMNPPPPRVVPNQEQLEAILAAETDCRILRRENERNRRSMEDLVRECNTLRDSAMAHKAEATRLREENSRLLEQDQIRDADLVLARRNVRECGVSISQLVRLRELTRRIYAFFPVDIAAPQDKAEVNDLERSLAERGVIPK